MNPSASSQHHASRRDFMKKSGASVAASALAGYALTPTAFAQGSDEIKIGLIGAGGRGSGAAVQALRADPNTKLTAIAEIFPDRLANAVKNLKGAGDVGARVTVDDDHKFTGFDGYKHVIDSCDLVILTTPPGFRPLHIEAAVKAGKHVFAEKPVAVDPPGIRRVLAACEEAKKKNLNVVSGLCYRYQFAKQETLKRVHAGEIGDIVSLRTYYNTGALWHRGDNPEWTEIEKQIRNWLYYTWLSGDHICEQHVHSLDKIAWAMQDVPPSYVVSSGGRISRTDPKYGNIYDHFNNQFVWEGKDNPDVYGFSSCRQIAGAAGDVSDHVFGTKGTAELQSHKFETRGGERSRVKIDGPDDMYQNEHDALFKAMRNGKTINNGQYMCQSSMMAIMARMSAYTGQKVTWEHAMQSNLDLTPPNMDWGPSPVHEVAIPGRTKLV